MAIKAFEVYGDVTLKDNGAEKKLDSFGKKAQKLGGNLTKFVTLPLLGVGAAMLKVANDQLQAEAALQNAINATGREAEISIDNLKKYTAELQNVTTYGDEAQLSALALVQQLGDLNEDGLKKILPSMLDFSAAMGVDLQTAASLIGKTLGSSTNALSRYGIQIDATAGPTEKLAQLTEAMNEKFNGAAETAAKTGLGPLVQLKNSVGDLAEEFGTLLLPTLNEIIDGLKKGLKWFADLDEGQKKMILTLAGIAAAAGPVISAIGGISRAISFLAANPIVAAIAGVAALTAAVIAVGAAKKKALLDEYTEDIREMAESAGVTSEAVKELSKDLMDLSEVSPLVFSAEGGIQEYLSTLGAIADKYNITRQEAAKLLLENENLNDASRYILENSDKYLAKLDAASSLSKGQVSDYAAMKADAEWIAGAEERKAAAAAAAAVEEARIAEELKEQLRIIREQTLQGRTDAYKDYLDQLEVVDRALRLGVITEKEAVAQRLQAQRGYVNYLIESGLDTEAAYNGHIDKLKELEAEYEKLSSTIVDQATLEREQIIANSDIYREEQLKKLEYDQWIAEELMRLQEIRAEKEKKDLDEIKKKYEDYAKTISGTVTPILNNLGKALVEGGSAWDSLAKSAISAIAGILKSLAEQAVIEAAMAFASGNVPGGLLFAAGATAAYIAAGVVEGYAGQYEKGGVIPGNSYTGDKMIARVNSGERILTAQQNAQYEAMMKMPAASYETTNIYNSRSEDTNVYVGEEKLFRIVQRGLDTQQIIPGRRSI